MKRAWVALLLAACARSRRPASRSGRSRSARDLVISVEVTGELEAVDSTDVKPPTVADMWNFKIASLADEGSRRQSRRAAGRVRSVGADASSSRRCRTSRKRRRRSSTRSATTPPSLAATRSSRSQKAEANVRKASLKTTAPADLVASVEQKTVELDEQLAKLALERDEEQSGPGGGAPIERRSRSYPITTSTSSIASPSYKPTSRRWRSSRRAPAPSSIRRTGAARRTRSATPAWRDETVLQVVALDKMVGKGEVDEVDIAQRRDAKQPVTLRLDALPDVAAARAPSSRSRRRVQRRRRQTDPSKVVESRRSRSIATKAPLRPGMRFRGEVETERVADVVPVPADAVFVTPEGPVAYRESMATRVKRRARPAQARRWSRSCSGLVAGDRVSRTDPRRRDDARSRSRCSCSAALGGGVSGHARAHRRTAPTRADAPGRAGRAFVRRVTADGNLRAVEGDAVLAAAQNAG